MWTWGKGGQKHEFFVDVINGWPLTWLNLLCVMHMSSGTNYEFVYVNA